MIACIRGFDLLVVLWMAYVYRLYLPAKYFAALRRYPGE